MNYCFVKPCSVPESEGNRYDWHQIYKLCWSLAWNVDWSSASKSKIVTCMNWESILNSIFPIKNWFHPCSHFISFVFSFCTNAVFMKWVSFIWIEIVSRSGIQLVAVSKLQDFSSIFSPLGRIDSKTFCWRSNQKACKLVSIENLLEARRHAVLSLASICMTFHVFPDFLQSFDIMNFRHDSFRPLKTQALVKVKIETFTLVRSSADQPKVNSTWCREGTRGKVYQVVRAYSDD